MITKTFCFRTGCRSKAEWSPERFWLCDQHTVQARTYLRSGKRTIDGSAAKAYFAAGSTREALKDLDRIQQQRRLTEPTAIAEQLHHELRRALLRLAIKQSVDPLEKRELWHRALITSHGALTPLGVEVCQQFSRESTLKKESQDG